MSKNTIYTFVRADYTYYALTNGKGGISKAIKRANRRGRPSYQTADLTTVPEGADTVAPADLSAQAKKALLATEASA
jgi:hypothetical protein